MAPPDVRIGPLSLLLLSYLSLSLAAREFDCSMLTDGDYPWNPKTCERSYVSCSNGYSYTRDCPSALVYDPTSGVCDHKDFVLVCGGTPRKPTTPAPPAASPSAVPFDCKGRVNGNYNLVPGKCSNQFVQCTNEIAWLNDCPGGLAFDPQNDWCDQPEYIRVCGGTPPERNPTTQPTFFCPTPDGDFPLPGNLCGSSYIWCSSGEATVRQCSPDELYDLTASQCRPAKLVPGCSQAVSELSDILRTHLVCPKESGSFPVPHEPPCGSLYILCGGWRPLIERCPEPLVFSPLLGACDEKDYVDSCNATIAFDCEGKSNGMYSEGCSTTYWWCWNGKGSKHACPDGLFFDQDNGQCTESTQIVACGGQPTQTTARQPVTTVDLPIDCGTLVNGDYGHPTGGCFNEFYTCSHGVGYLRHCPARLSFDPEEKVCARKLEIPACGGTRPQTNPTQRPPVFVCPAPDGDFPDPQRPCTRSYYWCMKGVPSFSQCRGNRIFSALSGECQDTVPECNTPPPPTRPNPTSAKPHFVCPESVGDFPDPERPCTRFYYWCSDGKAQLLECRDQKIFSSVRQECLPPGNVPECLAPATTQPSEPGFVCPGPFGDFVDPAARCTASFYWCQLSQPTPKQCSGNNIFSPSRQQCLDPSQVPECRPDTPPHFECPAVTGDFPDPERPCTRFYYWCEDGRADSVECLSGKIYSPVLEECQFIENVPECGVPTIPTNPPTVPPTRPEPTVPPQTKPTTAVDDFCGTREDGIFATDRCDPWYIKCVDGQSTLLLCEPEGTVFDQNTKHCDFPGNVRGCGGVPTTERTTRKTTPEPTPPGFCSGKPNGDFALGDCVPVFVRCWKGREERLSCTGELVFNPLTQGCALPIDVPTCPLQPTLPTAPPTRCTGLPDGQRIEFAPCKPFFIVCRAGQESVEACPDGQLFSQSVGCDIPQWIPGCEPSTEPTTQSEPTEPPTKPTTPSFCSDKPDGEYPLGGCSSSFVRCRGGFETFQKCSPGHVFDPRTRVCEQPAWVDTCPQTTPEPTTTQRPSDPPTTRECVEGTVQPTGSCNEEFSKCVDGQLVRRWCGPRRALSPTLLICIAVDDCVKPPLPTATTPASPAQCVNNEKIPLEPCGAEYIQCIKGNQVTKTCPSGTVFDPSILSCNAPERVGSCGVQPTTTEPSLCKGNEQIALAECSAEFIFCFKGTQVRRFCPSPTVFDPATLACLSSNLVAGCKADKKPSQEVPSTCEGNEKIPLGPCSEEFIYCFNGVVIRKWCPRGTVFDVSVATCQPERVVEGCKPPPSNPPLCVENEKLASGACEETFIVCLNGVPVNKWCPFGTVFDPTKGACQPPSVVAGCVVVTPQPTVSNPPDCQGYEKIPLGECSEEFIQCFNGVQGRKWCPAATVFDVTTLSCQPESRVPGCIVEPSPSNPPTECNGYEKIPIGTCSEEFIQCIAGVRVRKWCPAGTVMDASRLNCQPPQLVSDCQPPQTNPPAVCTEYEKTALGACEESFVICIKGQPVNKWCPGGLVFDGRDGGSCQPPAIVPGCAVPPSNPPTCTGYEKIPIGVCSEEFIQCINGVQVPKWCPAGTVFNSESLSCDPESLVKGCGPPPPSNPPDCSGYEKIPIGVCSEEFIQCINGVQVPKWCPQGTIFNSETLSCDPKNLVNGCAPAPSNPPTCSGYEKIPIGPCSEEFIQCIDGVQVPKWCPAGTIFDSSSLSCQPKTLVFGCGPAPSNPPTCSGYEKIPIGACSEEYIQCIDGVQVPKWCPAGTIFDSSSLSCQPKTIVSGCAPAPSNPPTCTAYEKIPIGACSEEYIQCIDGVQVPKWCPAGTIFDSSSLSCQPKSLVSGCGVVPSNPPSCTGYEKIPISDCSEEYIQCFNGVPGRKWCPRGTVFDGSSSSCQLPGDCGVVPSNPPTCDGFEKIPLGACSEEYIQCNNGVPVRKWCPRGTVFEVASISCQPPTTLPECGFTTVVPTTVEPTISNPCDGKPNGYKHALGQCVPDYCVCLNGLALFKKCGPGQVFEQEWGRCMAASQVPGCFNPVPSNPVPTPCDPWNPWCNYPVPQPPATIPPIIGNPCEGQEDGYKHPLLDCSEYYCNCTDGKPLLLKCEEGQVFEKAWDKCVSSASVAACYPFPVVPFNPVGPVNPIGQPCYGSEPWCSPVGPQAPWDPVPYGGYGQAFPPGLIPPNIFVPTLKVPTQAQIDEAKSNADCANKPDTTNITIIACSETYLQCNGSTAEERWCAGKSFDQVLKECVPLTEDPICFLDPPCDPAWDPWCGGFQPGQLPYYPPQQPYYPPQQAPCNPADPWCKFPPQTNPPTLPCDPWDPWCKFPPQPQPNPPVFPCDPAWDPWCTTTVAAPTMPASNPCEGQEDGYKHALGDCSAYYCNCTNGKPILLQCPPGQVWEDAWDKCMDARYIPGCCPANDPWCKSVPPVQPNPPVIPCDPWDPWCNLATPSPTTPPIVGNPCEGQEDGYKHALGTCSAYYCNCTNGKPILLQCPPGQVWEDAWDKCMDSRYIPGCCPPGDPWCKFPPQPQNPVTPCDPWNPWCNVTPAPPTVPPIVGNPCEGQEDGYKHALGACSAYYCNCTNGKPILLQCPPGQVWEDAWDKCMDSRYIPGCCPPNDPWCKVTPPPQTNPPQCPPGDPWCCDPAWDPWCKPTTTAPPQTNPPVCPPGDPWCCDPAWDPWCAKPTPPPQTNPPCAEGDPSCCNPALDPWCKPTVAPSNPPTGNPCAGQPNGSKHKLGDCNRDYCICWEGKPILQQCVEGQVFDGTQCVSSAICDPVPSNPPVTGNPCAGQPDGTKHKLGDCNRDYCLCWEQKPVLQQCGLAQVFDGSQCVSDVICNPTLPPTVSEPPSGNPCAGQPDGAKHKLGDCNRDYCYCWEGKPVLQQCAVGQVFDGAQCVSDAICKPTFPTVPPTLPPSEPPTGNPCAGQPDGAKHKLGDCNRDYCYCWKGKPVLQQCAIGQVFDGTQCVSDAICKPTFPTKPPPTLPPTVSEPPSGNPCAGQPDGAKHKLGDCNRDYCYCWKGKPVLQQCAVGQVFDGTQCVSDAICKPTFPTAPPTLPPSEPPTGNPCAGQPDGAKHKLGDCNRDYCYCWKGKPVLQQCAVGQVFDGTQCVSDLICKPTFPTVPPTLPPSEPPTGNPCAGQPDGSKHQLGNCNRDYCYCWKGKPVLQQCAVGQVFDGTQCVSDVICKPTFPTAPPTLPPSEPPTGNPCAGQPDGSKHKLGDCNRDYCYCWKGKPILQQCGFDQVFDGTQCVSSVICKPVFPTGPPTLPPSNPPSSNPCGGVPDGTRHHLGDCNQDYCLCWKGKPVFQQCGAGQVFSQQFDQCVLRSSVAVCNPTQPNPTEPPSGNPCLGQPNGATHALGECNTDYCLCWEGKPVFQQCPAGEVFEGGRCVVSAQCKAPLPTLPDPGLPDDKPCEGQDDGYLHALGSCNRDYCLCWNNKPIFQQCDPGQVFVKSLERCDFKFNVPSC